MTTTPDLAAAARALLDKWDRTFKRACGLEVQIDALRAALAASPAPGEVEAEAAARDKLLDTVYAHQRDGAEGKRQTVALLAAIAAYGAAQREAGRRAGRRRRRRL